MRSVIVSVIALAGTALATGPPHNGGSWGSSETGWGSTTSAVAVSTWSTSVAPSTSAAPYPVPGGNSTYAPTATQAPPASSPAPVCSEYVDGQPQCATSASAPAPSAPAATNAAGALTVGLSGAILAGVAAFVL